MECFFAYANGENRQSLKGQVKPYESRSSRRGIPRRIDSQECSGGVKKIKSPTKPFFLGVGFFKPICHLMLQKILGLVR